MLISSSEERVLDSILASAGASATLDKYRLKEFAISRAKNAILRKHPDWADTDKVDNEQMERLIGLNLQLDFAFGAARLIEEFIEVCKDLPQPKPVEVTEVAAPAEEAPKTVLVVAEIQKDKDIDKPVSGVIGRRTRLHLACEQGNYDEVVRLVEVCGANVRVKDSSNWTPRDRARYNNKTEGHARILKYFERFDSDETPQQKRG